MKRIIVHWTAGTHQASEHDRERYHYLIEGDGHVVSGKWPVSANEVPKVGRYAAHTLNCNTGSIGVSLCCMFGAVEAPFNSGKYPMTREQWDAMIILVAGLCASHKIAVTPQTVLSHAEVQKNLGIAQKGKWDIARLSFDLTTVGATACGDRLRREVIARMKTKVEPPTLADFATPENPIPTPKGTSIMNNNLFGTIAAVVAVVMGAMTQILGCATDAAGNSSCTASWIPPAYAGYAVLVFSGLALAAKRWPVATTVP